MYIKKPAYGGQSGEGWYGGSSGNDKGTPYGGGHGGDSGGWESTYGRTQYENTAGRYSEGGNSHKGDSEGGAEGGYGASESEYGGSEGGYGGSQGGYGGSEGKSKIFFLYSILLKI